MGRHVSSCGHWSALRDAICSVADVPVLIAELPSGNPPLQSQFTPFDLGLRRPLARKFDPHRQFLKLFARGLGRWLVTVVLVGASVGTLMAYSHPAIINEMQKRMFNAIITGLMLALNLNIQVSCSGM